MGGHDLVTQSALCLHSQAWCSGSVAQEAKVPRRFLCTLAAWKIPMDEEPEGWSWGVTSGHD